MNKKVNMPAFYVKRRAKFIVHRSGVSGQWPSERPFNLLALTSPSEAHWFARTLRALLQTKAFVTIIGFCLRRFGAVNLPKFTARGPYLCVEWPGRIRHAIAEFHNPDDVPAIAQFFNQLIVFRPEAKTCVTDPGGRGTYWRSPIWGLR